MFRSGFEPANPAVTDRVLSPLQYQPVTAVPPQKSRPESLKRQAEQLPCDSPKNSRENAPRRYVRKTGPVVNERNKPAHLVNQEARQNGEPHQTPTAAIFYSTSIYYAPYFHVCFVDLALLLRLSAHKIIAWVFLGGLSAGMVFLISGSVLGTPTPPELKESRLHNPRSTSGSQANACCPATWQAATKKGIVGNCSLRDNA